MDSIHSLFHKFQGFIKEDYDYTKRQMNVIKWMDFTLVERLRFVYDANEFVNGASEVCMEALEKEY